MNQHLLSAVLVVGFAATSAQAQAQAPAPSSSQRRSLAPGPVRVEPVGAPTPTPPGGESSAGAASNGAPSGAAPSDASSPRGASAGDAASAGAPAAPAVATQPAPANTTRLDAVAPVPPPGSVYVAPPELRGYVAPGAPVQQPQVRFASPRLYAIDPRPVPRRPRRYGNAGAPFAIGIGGGAIYRKDVGYELLSKSRGSAGFEISASYDVWAPSSLLVISAGLDFRSELHEAAEDISVAHYTAQAELNARLRATRWLWPHLRLAAGVVSTGFEAQDELGAIDYEDHDRGFAGTLGAGFTLRTPARTFETYNGRLSSLSLGVQLEGGYTLANAASLRAKPTGASEVERTVFPVGKLDRAGPYFRAMFVVRF